jgi:hypothetical protein
MSDTDSTLAGGESQLASLRMQRFVIGALVVALSVGSIMLVAASAPWQIRFPVVAAAAVCGPGVPILRIRPELSLEQCLVYGMGVDVALQMLVGLALVLWHIWVPLAASLVLFALSLTAGLKLLSDARKR